MLSQLNVVLFFRADILLGKEKIPEAKAMYEKVLKIDPKNDWATQRLRQLS